MPPKLANLKPRIVVRALKKGGFYIHQQTGAHVHLKHPTKPGRVTVPYPCKSPTSAGWQPVAISMGFALLNGNPRVAL